MHRVHQWVGRKDRHPVTVDAVVRRADGSNASVRLTNFSDEGCRIEADTHFHIGERVSIAIPRMGQVMAQVRWALAGSAGRQVPRRARLVSRISRRA
jgi:hypothetical protein